MRLVLPSRRGLIAGAAGLGATALAGCDRLSASPSFQHFIGASEGLTMSAQRLLLSGQPLAREFSPRDLSPVFKANGSTAPTDPAYQALAAGGFAGYRLGVSGLVRRPLQLRLADLKALPWRTQITRHDCVEGWSCIGAWTGVQLSRVLAIAGLQPRARFIVFHCADKLEPTTDESGRYYESIDLFDAFHPQTILAWALDGRTLDIAHGAPLRLRVERQLGYKSAKFVMAIEAVDDLRPFGRGKGGFWEDRGYQWYAGI
ncbi:MAG TPA: molybdopterin-dependent oxidoreductase [Caulobacteraceae bacterium]|nr:molybdopterin-dependent oxidoreductase [Caulobacteraceae bacterium]